MWTNFKKLKKVVYIHQYFKTPEEGGAIRSYYISKGMVDHGIEVELITSHNKARYEQKNIDGIRVHYLPIQYSNYYSFSKRYIAFFNFAFAAIKLSKKLPTPDLFYVTSTPLTVGIIALWVKWTKKIPYIFEVRDLWPEAPIQMGIIKSSLLKYLTIKLEKTIYKQAEKIIALSPGIEKGIINKFEKANISMIPNMADIDFFQKNSPEISVKKELVIGYFGTFGIANNLEYILDVAMECQKAKLPITYQLIGDGVRKKHIELKAIQMNLHNVDFLPHQNRSDIRDLLQQIDASFTCFLNIPILETNSPNKFFDGLASGKLNIVNTQGWLKELVEEKKCGFYTDPAKPENFPLLIEPFIRDKNLLKSYQKNSLQLGMTSFSKEKLVDEVCLLV